MLNQKLMGKVGEEKTYIEDVFSTYLYTGNGATQTIDNGIDLAGKGGMVWIKERSVGNANALYDTARGVRNALSSNFTLAQLSAPAGNELTAFNSNGFSIGTDYNYNVNTTSQTFASWTFRKAPKFFDVVTYTGNGVNGRTISHSLGQAPGMVIIKRTDASENWGVFHRGNGTGNAWTGLSLNSTAAGSQGTAQATVTDTTVNVTDIWGASSSPAWFNVNGATYVAYLFAHDTTTDGMIQCGSYTGNGSTNGPTVTLGWEPQYLMIKSATSAYGWRTVDSMRGFSYTSTSILEPNTSSAEYEVSPTYVTPNASGFQLATSAAAFNASGQTYIYMAIRRPMKVPTDGTKVYSGNTVASTTAGQVLSTDFPVDLSILKQRTNTGNNWFWFDRLRGDNYLSSNATIAETSADYIDFDYNTGIESVISIGSTPMYWNFKRAPGFFDVVCYTGTGSARTVNHNLGVAPELIIAKCRSSTGPWPIYQKDLGVGSTARYTLNTTIGPGYGQNAHFYQTPTTTQFYVGTDTDVNGNGSTYVAYLFASCPGVSKVGSYTGTGTTNNIDCGFTNGARFVLIKRTDASGGWYVVDTARGIVDGNDPYLTLNTTVAEGASLDFIDPYAPGFALVNGSSAFNAVGGSYIYLAIA